MKQNTSPHNLNFLFRRHPCVKIRLADMLNFRLVPNEVRGGRFHTNNHTYVVCFTLTSNKVTETF